MNIRAARKKMKPIKSKCETPLRANQKIISEDKCEEDESDDSENDDTSGILCNQ